MAATVLPPSVPALAQALWHFVWHLHVQAWRFMSAGGTENVTADSSLMQNVSGSDRAGVVMGRLQSV